MGWLGIYSLCFSQFDGDKDSLLLDGGFSFLIAVRLIRNNWKAVIENYPNSLIGEIWFDLQNKQLLGNLLLSLLVSKSTYLHWTQISTNPLICTGLRLSAHSYFPVIGGGGGGGGGLRLSAHSLGVRDLPFSQSMYKPINEF